MIKDYNANTTNGADSEDEEDPRTPTSVTSQGSQGYDSAGSDFVDIEGFTSIPDSSLPELQLQVHHMKQHYRKIYMLFFSLLFAFFLSCTFPKLISCCHNQYSYNAPPPSFSGNGWHL